LIETYTFTLINTFSPTQWATLRYGAKCTAAICASISEVVFENLTTGERVLDLRQNTESVAVLPTQFGEPPIVGGVL
jgi:hypothetical protein